MLRSNPSVVERLYSRAGRDNRSVLFFVLSCWQPKSDKPARKPINRYANTCTHRRCGVEKTKRESFGVFSLCALAEAIRLAEQFNDVRMMRETIKQRGGQTFVAKDLHPIGELEVGGDDQSESFIKFRAKSEEGLCAILRKGDETQFIQNH